VFEEEYTQQVTWLPEVGMMVRRQSPPVGLTQARRLRSEVVVLHTADLGWIGFRDVFEVDGKPIRDREDRLQKLFANVTTDSLVRARALADESARFNLGSVQRNLNYPTMALMFLRQAHQTRSTFNRGGSDRVGGVATWTVRFQETERPTLIGSKAADVVASGQFWIEPDNGRVRRSRLILQEGRATGTIEVEYGPWPDLELLMPVTMEENIQVRGGDPASPPAEMIRGEARYSNVRRFTVSVKTEVPLPK
jgi:hypothetical protein